MTDAIAADITRALSLKAADVTTPPTTEAAGQTMKASSLRCRSTAVLLGLLIYALLPAGVNAQGGNRIRFNDQDLFLSGGNVAWVNFARDIGPGTTDLARFREIFGSLHSAGGNSMRLWLHTTGGTTPEWEGSMVTGPGSGSIEDLRDILDAAWENEIGLLLCLWSFDMLRISNGTTITDRSYDLLTDPVPTQTYIDNALVPMVDSLAGHPAIIAWEIFNEPEGMSVEHGWSFNRHVPMSAIQRFINMTAGAIHRTDTTAKVTNGAWAFISASDSPAKMAKHASELTSAELLRIRRDISAKYAHNFSAAQTEAFVDALSTAANYNYYTDDRLIAEGRDLDGTLDFYTVHYYEWAGTSLSPFHNDYTFWGLDKPLAIAEFFMGEGSDGDPDRAYGIHYSDLYTTLYDHGFAGALAWQWYNYPTGAEGVINWPRMLESTQTIYQLHPEAVDINPGLRIVSFRADPPDIETGQGSELSWSVVGASQITLDDEQVDSVGTRTVFPLETTTYTLAVTSLSADTDTARVTVRVVSPNEVNRARGRPAFASTLETCCGAELVPSAAVDGDADTRWSSEWMDGLADDDPDDEWIYVELDTAYSVERIVLQWEVAYGSSYDIDVSYDGRFWTTVHEERSGDGGTDEITFAAPPGARFVRMHGLTRATGWGFSLWEFEIYGLVSARQPPNVSLVSPFEGALLAPGQDHTFSVDASDVDGTVEKVDFYVGEQQIGSVTAAPYAVDWMQAAEGDYSVWAVATDNDEIAVSTPRVPVYVYPTAGFARYEAEAASLDGDMSAESAGDASGSRYLYLRDSGTFSFDNVDRASWGQYLLAFRYRLPFGFKAQYLYVNGEQIAEVGFDGPLNQWLTRAVKVELPPGSSTIAIEKYWGWMHFDFIELGGTPLNVSAEAPDEIPDSYSLSQNYPNPFNPGTVISFALPRSGHVRLSVFDLTGRRVAVPADGMRAAGVHTVRFDAGRLASGVYLYTLETDVFTRTRSMVVLR